MKKVLIILIVCFLSLISNSVFSQNQSEIAVTGTVYISSSVSQGIMNGETINEGTYIYRKQAIYFINDSITVKALTDSTGVFSVTLKPATYIIEQEAALQKKKSGLNHFGQFVITVKKDGGPYKILFENSSSRRSTMNSGFSNSGLPGTKATKTTKTTHNTSEKK